MTFDTTTFASAGWAADKPRVRPSHDAIESNPGGVTSANSAMAVGPTAAVNSLAATDAWCTAANSSTGDRSSVANVTSIVVSVLVPAASPSPALTGTAATSGRSGSASRAARYRRNDNATTASTTSFSVTPAATLTA